MSAIVKLTSINKDLHAESLYKWRKDPEISRYMYSPGPSTFEDHLRWLDRIEGDPSQIHFLVEQNGKPVGTVSLSSISDLHQRAELGMYIGDANARLRGAGAVAEFQMLDYGFHELNLHKISCEVFSQNEAAIRMHLRMGFSQEGISREHAFSPTEWFDVTRLSILDREWEATRGKLLLALEKIMPTTKI